MTSPGLGKAERASLAVLTAALVSVLGVAAWLVPEPSGLGTHQQLGLPACTSVSILGIRCPACGMTTSWALMAEGRVPEAIRANLGGSLLFIVAACSVPWLVGILWTSSCRLRDQWGLFALSGSLVSMAIALVLWAWNLVTTKLQNL
ncbi:MAG: DUF2752 domain-containing protein [Planctomycetota bacterium]|jgi:hypothetical protein|nr:DUF2752 domain-containing protein [Planctomycetota bacterium]